MINFLNNSDFTILWNYGKKKKWLYVNVIIIEPFFRHILATQIKSTVEINNISPCRSLFNFNLYFCKNNIYLLFFYKNL